MRHVLVTGGAGFIGSNLVDLIRHRGHTVTVIDDLSSGYRANLRLDVRFVKATSGTTAIDAAVAGRTWSSLAASVGNSDPSTIRYMTPTSTCGTLKVLEACRRGVRKLVFPSSAGILGSSSPADPRIIPPSRISSPAPASWRREALPRIRSCRDGMRRLRYFTFTARTSATTLWQRHSTFVTPSGTSSRRDLGDGDRRATSSTSTMSWKRIRRGDHARRLWVFIASGTRISINDLATLVSQASGSSGPVCSSASGTSGISLPTSARLVPRLPQARVTLHDGLPEVSIGCAGSQAEVVCFAPANAVG